MYLYNKPGFDFSKAKRMKCLDKKDLFGHDLNILLEKSQDNFEAYLEIEYRFVGDLYDENLLAKYNKYLGNASLVYLYNNKDLNQGPGQEKLSSNT